jgi:crotonobetainyl-CoA:carnitine CoA-transferase CaiB-like acyl-CoA transferase
VAGIIATKTAREWARLFEGVDACVSVVRTLKEAVQSRHFTERKLFDRRLSSSDGLEIPALPLPLAPCFRLAAAGRSPSLGEAAGDFLTGER